MAAAPVFVSVNVIFDKEKIGCPLNSTCKSGWDPYTELQRTAGTIGGTIFRAK